VAVDALHSLVTIMCLALANKQPADFACRSMPAPNDDERISRLLKSDCAAGEMTATRLLSCFEASLPDIVPFLGKRGYSDRSSSSASPLPTTEGNGPRENTTTTASDVRIPLMTSSVDKYAVHAWRVRGG